MSDVLKMLQQIRANLELNIQGEKILDIVYYGTINLSKNDTDLRNQSTQDLYLIKKENDGNIQFEFFTDDGVLATVDKEGVITITEQFKDQINDKEFLIQMRKATPISLKKLEEMTKQESIKDDLENDRQIDGDTKANQNNKDIEIDLDKKITETMTFADLVPEIRKKDIQQVKVRRKDNSKFEFYGINSEGQEVRIESLQYTEGTNPNENVVEVNQDGSKVSNNQVLTMVKIQKGNNEGYENEGFTIDIGSYGVPEVNYYRRAPESDTYTSIPVNTKNTNQKQVDLDVREYAEKTRNSRSRR